MKPANRIRPCSWEEVFAGAATDMLLTRCGAVVCAFHHLEQSIHDSGVSIGKGRLTGAVQEAHNKGLISSSKDDLKVLLEMRHDLVHGLADHSTEELVAALEKVKQIVASLQPHVFTRHLQKLSAADVPEEQTGAHALAISLSLEADGYYRLKLASRFVRHKIYVFYDTKSTENNTVKLEKLIFIGHGPRVAAALQTFLKSEIDQGHFSYSVISPAPELVARVEQALIAQHKPPLNDLSQSQHAYAETTIHLSGRCSLLTPQFSVHSNLPVAVRRARADNQVLTAGSSMRVYEVAKNLEIPNKDLIAFIRALGIEVNNHMTSLPMEDVARIQSEFRQRGRSSISRSPVPVPVGPVLQLRRRRD